MRVRAAIHGTAAAWLLLAASASACPSDAQRQALLAQANAATDLAISESAWRSLAAAAHACGDAKAEADALAGLVARARTEGPVDHLIVLEGERAEFAHEHGLRRDEAEARGNVGKALLARGDLEGARAALEAARASFEAIGARLDEATARSELSRIERRRGDYLAALREELAGLDLRRRFAPGASTSRSLLSLATLYEQIELFTEARTHYAAALAEAERSNIATDIADALNGYAGFLNDFGGEDSRQALPMAQRALSMHEPEGDPARNASTWLQIGRANFGLGRYDEAQAAYERVAELADRSGTLAMRAHVDFRWGELDLERGDLQGALGRMDAARAEYERQGNRHRLIKVYGALARVYDGLGDPLASARAGREHFRLRNELLGANATGRLGELLTNFALTEERLRSEKLSQENAVAALKLEAERRTRLAAYAVALVVLLALAVLAWRHATVQRLYRVLDAHKQEIEAQGRTLADTNALLREQSVRLLAISITDSLTGLSTRAHGIEQLARMLDVHREMGTRPALLIIDVDHFKKINDRYGHPAGDAVLVAMAQTLREALPEDAAIARLGGEEFMVALNDGDADRAPVLADVLRRRVRDLRVDVGSKVLQVTISIGYCGVGETAERSVRELFTCADRALYAAKHAGRDCVRGFRSLVA